MNDEELRGEHTQKRIMKLTTELVPSPCFYSNLRNQVTWAECNKHAWTTDLGDYASLFKC